MTLLHRVCPEQNMARFYALSVERSLFGDFVVVRLWGRIGRRGQSKTESFDAEPEAERRLLKLADIKRRRGYVDRPCEAVGSSEWVVARARQKPTFGSAPER